MPHDFDAAYWEARYDSHTAHRIRPPSLQLLAEIGQLAPGTALDAGCGDGSNGLWLAERGWRVTAVDVSPTALRRAREHAGEHRAKVADHIEWVEADLTTWEPPRESFDLVAAHYVHPAGPRMELLRRLAAAVAPGGTLFVVDHDLSDKQAHAHSSPDELADSLDPEAWEVQIAENRVRQDTDPHDQEITMSDAVLRARKRH